MPCLVDALQLQCLRTQIEPLLEGLHAGELHHAFIHGTIAIAEPSDVGRKPIRSSSGPTGDRKSKGSITVSLVLRDANRANEGKLSATIVFSDSELAGSGR